MSESKVAPDTGTPDVDLLNAIANKDRSALSLLYDRYAPKLYGLALKILQEDVLAQDVLQDLFLFLWENADRFVAKRGSPIAWMMILCRNRCIDKLRQREKKDKRSTEIDEATLALIDWDESKSPLDVVHHRELERKIADALKTLPEEQRAPIQMAFFKGRSQSEIAAELQLPLGTVKTRIRLGMQKLRELLHGFR